MIKKIVSPLIIYLIPGQHTLGFAGRAFFSGLPAVELSCGGGQEKCRRDDQHTQREIGNDPPSTSAQTVSPCSDCFPVLSL